MKLRVSLRFSSAATATIPVGELWDVGRDMAFRYDSTFQGRGLPLSPFRLPLRAEAFVHDPSGGLETFGVFADSLPDGWGRRLVDQRFFATHRRLPTVLERLALVGTRGRGALVYEPEDPLGEEGDSTFDFAALAENAMDFDAGRAETVLPALRRAGGSSGGARPKAFVTYNPSTGEVGPDVAVPPTGFVPALVKFNTRAEGPQAGRCEYAYYEAARAAGADMMESWLIRTTAGEFFATRRFDREADGTRRHVASAAGLLQADFHVPGDEYEILFRLTDALTHDYEAKKELFRRAALNVLGHNRDDHLKNFGFMMDEQGTWSLAPFYDFTYAEGPNGWQTLSIAGEGANPGEADLLRLAATVSLRTLDAREILERVHAALAHSLGADSGMRPRCGLD